MFRFMLIAINAAVWMIALGVAGSSLMPSATTDFCELGGVITPDGYEGGEEPQANGNCDLVLRDKHGNPAPDYVYERIGHRPPGSPDPTTMNITIPAAAISAAILFTAVTVALNRQKPIRPAWKPAPPDRRTEPDDWELRHSIGGE